LNYCGDGLGSEAHGDGGRGVLRGAAREFGERETALVAVACAERSGDMISGHFLEFGEMLFGGLGIAAALIGAG